MDPKIVFMLWGALCFIVGAVFMAFVRVERGDLEEEDDINMMEDEEEW